MNLALDLIRDFAGWLMCIFMAVMVWQRRDWIKRANNGIRMDAQATQMFGMAMIVSVVGWNVLFGNVGGARAGAAYEFVVFAIVMRFWLAYAAFKGCMAHWSIIHGWDCNRSVFQGVGWAVIAAVVTVIFI